MSLGSILFPLPLVCNHLFHGFEPNSFDGKQNQNELRGMAGIDHHVWASSLFNAVHRSSEYLIPKQSAHLCHAVPLQIRNFHFQIQTASPCFFSTAIFLFNLCSHQPQFSLLEVVHAMQFLSSL